MYIYSVYQYILSMDIHGPFPEESSSRALLRRARRLWKRFRRFARKSLDDWELYGVLVGFDSDLMGYKWDVASGN